ncbi:DEAD/DEAH box helicase family protein [Desulfobacula sp.]|uniref:DEAD/DEAH box helicase family protein n=1 Tax=Desulfobacula sp. TaxID=2593537 RepID=UPI00261407A9|nr:DEAD/DEAH box helicase family protein [Desulfobacula sp.]
MAIQPGLYEQLITQALKQELDKLDNGLQSITTRVDTEESHGILARYMEHYLAGILARVKGRDKLAKQITVCNKLISSACKSIEKDQDGHGHIDIDGRRLLQVLDPALTNSPRPETPLSVGALLTATSGDPSLVSQLKQEMLHADGLEWNVKLCQQESGHLWEKINATFETYLRSREFEPVSLESLPRLDRALNQERGGGAFTADQELSFFNIVPYTYQQEILDTLKAERALHHRCRNLVVAATGTGKTIIAAFDFKHSFDRPQQTRILFVAHREEILVQSRWVFRNILRDNNFGELWVGNHRPDHLEQLFVSVQTLNARALWDQVPPDFFDYIVVDEFHHGAAIHPPRETGSSDIAVCEGTEKVQLACLPLLFPWAGNLCPSHGESAHVHCVAFEISHVGTIDPDYPALGCGMIQVPFYLSLC